MSHRKLHGTARRRWITICAAATIAGLCATVPAGAEAAPATSSPATSSPATLRPAPLTWAPCVGIPDPRLQCAQVPVPLDYTHPDGRQISIGISRLPASNPATRRGVLLTTGGGPSMPGVPVPEQLSSVLGPRVLADYDLIGFDPRFLERSTPVSCGQPTEEPGAFWVRSATYQPFLRTAWQAASYALDCARSARWALPYATTDNVARDMDRIRAALGAPKISYVAGSYAGMLGAVYATLYPHRVDRFVLDSPSNFDIIWRGFELGRTPSFEAGFAEFAAFVAGNDAGFHLGTSAAAVEQTIKGLYRRAPFQSTGRTWTYNDLAYLTLLGMLSQQLRPVAAADLSAVAGGAPALPVPLPIEPVTSPGVTGVPADNHTAVNTMFRCADGEWSRNPIDYLKDLHTYTAAYPDFGPVNANINPCAFWPITGGRDHVQLGTRQSPGVLVTASTSDPAVPISNATATARAIDGSRLVTMTVDSHVPYTSGLGNSCMTSAVDTYLLDGRLPAHDVACGS